MPTNWRVYQRDTVAARLEAADIPGFLRKQVVIGPNEAALVVRDGQPGEVLTENRIAVAGVFDRVKSWFGLRSDVTVYFIDLSPFDVNLFLGESLTEAAQFSGGAVGSRAAGSGGQSKTLDLAKSSSQVGWAETDDAWTQQSGTTTSRVDLSRIAVVALSSDREIVQASCLIRLAVDLNHPDPLDNAIPLLALLKGKRALASWDIAALLRDEVMSKVLVPEIAKSPAAGLRSDQSLLTRLESQTRDVLSRTLADCGLRLDRFSIAWGLTESERAEIAQQRGLREEKSLEFAKTRRIAHLNREQEVEKLRLQNLQELKTAQSRGDQELKNILLLGDLERDRLVANNEIDLAQVEAKIRDITLGVEKKESLARLEDRRAQDELRLDIEDRETKQRHAARLLAIDAGDKEMWSMVKMQIEMANQKHDRETSRRRQEIDSEFRKMQADIENRFQQRKLKLDESLARMGVIERLVGQGISAGAADSNVLKTMLEQMTEQEYATTSDAMVESRSKAQAARNDVDLYRQAQGDERRHQVDMTRLSAEMMNAAKPLPSPAASPPNAYPGVVAPVSYVPVAAPPPTVSAASARPCGNCGQGLQASWKACPACGTAVSQGPCCPGCGQGVHAAWKACPACGQGLIAAKPKCRSCGADVQPNWKACPACGNGL